MESNKLIQKDHLEREKNDTNHWNTYEKRITKLNWQRKKYRWKWWMEKKKSLDDTNGRKDENTDSLSKTLGQTLIIFLYDE